jgi:hypothetical protein
VLGLDADRLVAFDEACETGYDIRVVERQGDSECCATSIDIDFRGRFTDWCAFPIDRDQDSLVGGRSWW